MGSRLLADLDRALAAYNKAVRITIYLNIKILTSTRYYSLKTQQTQIYFGIEPLWTSIAKTLRRPFWILQKQLVWIQYLSLIFERQWNASSLFCGVFIYRYQVQYVVLMGYYEDKNWLLLEREAKQGCVCTFRDDSESHSSSITIVQVCETERAHFAKKSEIECALFQDPKGCWSFFGSTNVRFSLFT